MESSDEPTIIIYDLNYDLESSTDIESTSKKLVNGEMVYKELETMINGAPVIDLTLLKMVRLYLFEQLHHNLFPETFLHQNMLNFETFNHSLM